MLKILFASSEVQPLIKTGGLADVSGALPLALADLKHEVRIILPAYAEVLDKLPSKALLGREYLPGTAGQIKLWQSLLPGSKIPLLLVDYPPAFQRRGNPYSNEDGQPWEDNAERFNIFCQMIYRVAMGQTGLNWMPDMVHCNDWQTGLAPALLHQHRERPATLFTIHNLAYQGLFPYDTFHSLGLPFHFWQQSGLEYHGQMSFIKGGIAYADRINTVSPKYMEEITTAEFGYGLEGLLLHRGPVCSGIVNGIDETVWNPAQDPLIKRNFTVEDFPRNKPFNKLALQEHYQLAQDQDKLLIGFIGRLVEQKGVDVILQYARQYMPDYVQLVILGSGDRSLEQKLLNLHQAHSEQVGVEIGYNEELAHQIEAGLDLFLMPSRFEPCGLNQMYSQRYGTLPVVNDVGGLSNTVRDATQANLKAGAATGFILPELTAKALNASIQQAYELFQNQTKWHKLVSSAMAMEFSWKKSAQAYVKLYQSAINDLRIQKSV